MSKIIDARGDACPIPVIKTKNAIKESAPKDVLEVLVDNELAVQNLTKMATQLGLAVSSEAKAPNDHAVTITLGDTLPNLSAATLVSVAYAVSTGSGNFNVAVVFPSVLVCKSLFLLLCRIKSRVIHSKRLEYLLFKEFAELHS